MTDETDIDVFSEGELQGADADEQGWIPLPSVDLLSIEGADELLRQYPAKIIAVVGERDAGKTTLVTEIYERYLRGAFAGFNFADSRTLIGFERKSFLSRADSGEDTPDTPRTSIKDGLRFFHLALSSDDDGRRRDLLIAERAGEAYKNARDTPSQSADLLELQKAQIVVLILDGRRVTEHKHRSEAFAAVRGIARAMVDSGALSPQVELHLVTTKCDLLDGGDGVTAQEALKTFEDSFSSLFSDRCASVKSFRTAARDPTGRIEAAREFKGTKYLQKALYN